MSTNFPFYRYTLEPVGLSYWPSKIQVHCHRIHNTCDDLSIQQNFGPFGPYRFLASSLTAKSTFFFILLFQIRVSCIQAKKVVRCVECNAWIETMNLTEIMINNKFTKLCHEKKSLPVVAGSKDVHVHPSHFKFSIYQSLPRPSSSFHYQHIMWNIF